MSTRTLEQIEQDLAKKIDALVREQNGDHASIIDHNESILAALREAAADKERELAEAKAMLSGSQRALDDFKHTVRLQTDEAALKQPAAPAE